MAAYTKKTINRIQEGSSSSPVTWNNIFDQVEENFDDVQTGVNAHVDDQSNPHNVTSTQIPYSNIDSGLDSETVKAAIDELDFKFGQGATNLPTPGTLVKRDLEGRARIEDPSHDLDIVNKQFTETTYLKQNDAETTYLKQDDAETTIKQTLNADNNPPVYGVRAWANFDGEDFDGSGIIQNIRGSGNISQIERVSEGLYQITFDIPMPDANYAVPVGMAQDTTTAGNYADQANVYDFQTTGFKMESDNNTSTEFGADCALLTFCVVR